MDMTRKFQGIFFIALLLLLLTLLEGCSSHRVVKRYTGAQAEQYLRRRMWVDRYPENAKQPFTLYYFDDDQPLGIHLRAYSSFKRVSEYFEYRADAEKISFNFLHDERKADTNYILEEIKPEGKFNLKLTILRDPQEKGSRHEFFSNTAWRNSRGLQMPGDLKAFSIN
jgi:hypothetical protein